MDEPPYIPPHAPFALTHGQAPAPTRDTPLYANLFSFLGGCFHLIVPNPEQNACVICLDEFTHEDFQLSDYEGRKPTRTRCGHRYHMSCLLRYMTVSIDLYANIYPTKCSACSAEWYPRPGNAAINALAVSYTIDIPTLTDEDNTSSQAVDDDLPRAHVAPPLHSRNVQEDEERTRVEYHQGNMETALRRELPQRPSSSTDDPINVPERNIREALGNSANIKTYLDRALQDTMRDFYRAHTTRIDRVEDDELRYHQRVVLMSALRQTRFNFDYARNTDEIRERHFDADLQPVPLPRDFPSRDSANYQWMLRRWWAAREFVATQSLGRHSSLELTLYRRQTRLTLEHAGFEFKELTDIDGFEICHVFLREDFDRYFARRETLDDYHNSNPWALPRRIQESRFWTDVERLNNNSLMQRNIQRAGREPLDHLRQMWDSSQSMAMLCTLMENA